MGVDTFSCRQWFYSWADGYKLELQIEKHQYIQMRFCMFMLDLEILNNTNGNESLHSVFLNYIMSMAQCKGYSEKTLKYSYKYEVSKS